MYIQFKVQGFKPMTFKHVSPPMTTRSDLLPK